MSLRLKPHWVLLKDPRHFYLVNRDYPRPTWWALDWRHFFVLGSLDGLEEVEAIGSRLAAAAKTSLPLANALVQQVLRRYHHCLVEAGRSALQSPELRRSDELLPVSQKQRMRQCAPLRLFWVATTDCSKHCRYCYMAATPAQPGSRLPVEIQTLRNLASEAAQLAVSEMQITGGDPFVLDGMYDAINLLLEHEIHLTVGTKGYVDCGRLSEAATRWLVVEQSLDSTDPTMVAYLTDRANAYDEALASLRGLAAAGIEFRMKMVVGKCNVDAVLPVAALADELGACAVQVIPYRPSSGRNLDDFELGECEKAKVLEAIHAARQRFRVPVESELLKADDQDEPLPASHCAEGIKSLSFLPDGACTRCPGVPFNREITAGNVFDDGIYAAWNDNRDYSAMVFPDRERYRGTDCFECERFDECNQTGRCILVGLRQSGSHFGPDRDCVSRPARAVSQLAAGES